MKIVYENNPNPENRKMGVITLTLVTLTLDFEVSYLYNIEYFDNIPNPGVRVRVG